MLAHAGLSPKPAGDGVWTCVLAGPRPVAATARATPNWIVLETAPLAPAPAPARAPSVHRALLRANEDLRFARFAIAPSGEPVLRAELPRASLQPGEVAAVVASLIEGLSRLDALLGST